MEIRPREVRNYVTPDGREPFEKWLDSLKDQKTKTIIIRRIERLQRGNFGDCTKLNGDLYELRACFKFPKKCVDTLHGRMEGGNGRMEGWKDGGKQSSDLPIFQPSNLPVSEV